MMCDHDDFAAEVHVYRLTATEGGPVTSYTAEISVRCHACSEPFRWIGPPIGLLADEPTTDVLGFTLRAPLEPAAGPPNVRDIPGFTVRFREPQ